MRKLLTLMSALMITGATTVSVVACKTPENNQHKDENGNSIWAWLPGLSDKPVNSADVWNNLADPLQPNKGGNDWSTNPSDWDGPTRLKMALQLSKILSVSILANADTLFNEDVQDKLKDIADYKDLKSILNQQWEALKLSVDNAVQNKKDDLKEQYQKKWEDEWHKFLDKNYPDITGKSGNEKYEIEEKNYRASLMINGDNSVTSATQLLTNVLLKNNMRKYNSDGLSSIQVILTNFNDYLKNGGDVDNWTASEYDKQTLAIAYSYDDRDMRYSGLTDPNFINTQLKAIATKLEAANYKIDVFSQTNTAYDAPKFAKANPNGSIDLSSLSLSNSSIDQAQLSMFQRYMLSQWFINEKPLAISQITYKYKDGLKPFTDRITKNYFDESVQTDIQNDLNSLSSVSSWNDFYQFISKSGTASSEKKLITLTNNDDAAKSTFLKYNVYRLASSVGGAPKDVDTTLDNLIANANRGNDSTLSVKYKFGTGKEDKVVVFFDDDGLHIVHIDGIKFLKDSSELKFKTYGSDWQLNSLGYSNNTFPSAVKKDINAQITAVPKLNSQFSSTPYLQYLVNMSASTAINTTSRYKFNVFDEVANYAKLDSSTDPTSGSTWWTWIYDFFNDLFTNEEIGIKNDKWIDSLLKFQNNPQSGDESSSAWYTSILGSVTSVLKGGAKNSFISKIEQTNNSITENNLSATGTIDSKAILDFINISQFWRLENKPTAGGNN